MPGYAPVLRRACAVLPARLDTPVVEPDSTVVESPEHLMQEIDFYPVLVELSDSTALERKLG